MRWKSVETTDTSKDRTMVGADSTTSYHKNTWYWPLCENNHIILPSLRCHSSLEQSGRTGDPPIPQQVDSILESNRYIPCIYNKIRQRGVKAVGILLYQIGVTLLDRLGLTRIQETTPQGVRRRQRQEKKICNKAMRNISVPSRHRFAPPRNDLAGYLPGWTLLFSPAHRFQYCAQSVG